MVTAIIGIIICPWWLLSEISDILIFISGLLGPVLGIMLCDYYFIKKKNLQLAELYKEDGIYSFGGSGFNAKAMICLLFGVGMWRPPSVFEHRKVPDRDAGLMGYSPARRNRE